MPAKPTRREARKMRFHARIKGAENPKAAFHEAVRYLAAELADTHNADEAEATGSTPTTPPNCGTAPTKSTTEGGEHRAA